MITDPAKLDAYAKISDLAYDQVNDTENVSSPSGTYFDFVVQLDSSNGFQARAFYNSTENEVVIAFAGTEGGQNPFSRSELAPDLVTDLYLATVGAAPQVASAHNFIDQVHSVAADRGYGGYKVTYVGHSMGGFLAQAASEDEQEGEVVAFNAPGAGGFLGLPKGGSNMKGI